MPENPERLDVPSLLRRKRSGEKVVMLSVPDFPHAIWAERAGVEVVVVGDSLGMTVYGHGNTLPVTIDDMVRHTSAVRRGAPNTFCLAAMPYGSFATPDIGIRNALRVMQEGGADAVKMQGGRSMEHVIRAIAGAGVPVMSHVGLTPHFVHQLGGFKAQGRTADAAIEVLEDARAIESAGAIGMEVEAVPAEVAQAIEESVDIFTFGIGAGHPSCGQALLAADLLGAFDRFQPKFSKRYSNFAELAVEAIGRYAQEVREGTFPDDEHSYHMKKGEADELQRLLAEQPHGRAGE